MSGMQTMFTFAEPMLRKVISFNPWTPEHMGKKELRGGKRRAVGYEHWLEWVQALNGRYTDRREA